MKVGPALTISTSDETSLPSLLSSESDKLSPKLAEPIVSTDDPSQSSSHSYFEAMLAMFVLPPNLPVPSPPTLVPADSSNAVPLTTITQSLNIGTALEPRLPTDTAVIEPAPLTPSTTVSTKPFEKIAKQADQIADTPIVSPNAATSPLEETAPDPTSPRVPAPKVATDISVPSSPVKLSVSDAEFLHPVVESNAVANLSATTESSVNPKLMRVVPEFTTPTEISSLPHQIEERPRVFSGEKPQRQRHATTERQPTAELAAPISHASDLSTNTSNPLDSHSLAEQLSVALQNHGAEITSGKPIEVRLQLDPPELGMVRVHLRLSEEGISVRFIAGDEAVTRILESQLPDLRQSLAERGLVFARCDVMCDSHQQQSSSFGRDTDQPSFVPIQLKTSTWSRPSFANRPIVSRADGINILA